MPKLASGNATEREGDQNEKLRLHDVNNEQSLFDSVRLCVLGRGREEESAGGVRCTYGR